MSNEACHASNLRQWLYACRCDGNQIHANSRDPVRCLTFSLLPRCTIPLPSALCGCVGELRYCFVSSLFRSYVASSKPLRSIRFIALMYVYRTFFAGRASGARAIVPMTEQVSCCIPRLCLEPIFKCWLPFTLSLQPGKHVFLALVCFHFTTVRKLPKWASQWGIFSNCKYMISNSRRPCFSQTFELGAITQSKNVYLTPRIKHAHTHALSNLQTINND